MVKFVKNSDNYGLYIVESSVGGDDWLDDHDHIKELDGDLITEGSDGIQLPYVSRDKNTPNFNIQIIDFFEGAAVDISLGEGHWLWTGQGRFGGASEAARNTKMGNLSLLFNKHLSLTGGKLYLGVRKVGEVWEPHINASQAIKPYLAGKLLLADHWREANKNYENWKVVFRGVW